MPSYNNISCSSWISLVENDDMHGSVCYIISWKSKEEVDLGVNSRTTTPANTVHTGNEKNPDTSFLKNTPTCTGGRRWVSIQSDFRTNSPKTSAKSQFHESTYGLPRLKNTPWYLSSNSEVSMVSALHEISSWYSITILATAIKETTFDA